MTTLLSIVKEHGIVTLIEEMCMDCELKTCDCCEKNILENDILIENTANELCNEFCYCKDCESELEEVEYGIVDGKSTIIQFETDDAICRYINNEEWVDNTDDTCFTCYGGNCGDREANYDDDGSHMCIVCDNNFCGEENHYVNDVEGNISVYCGQCFVNEFQYNRVDWPEHIIEKSTEIKYNLADIIEYFGDEERSLDIHNEIIGEIEIQYD